MLNLHVFFIIIKFAQNHCAMIMSNEQRDDEYRINDLTERERVALDAYLFNPSNKIQAYLIAKNISHSNEEQSILNVRANKWLNNKDCKAYLSKNKALINSGLQSQTSQLSDLEQLTKEDLLKILHAGINSTTDIKLKSDLAAKYADLQGFKKDKTEKDDKRVLYYLPVRCDSCSFKKDFCTRNDITD